MTEDNTFDVKNNFNHLITEEKNKHTVYCTKCPSKILSSTMGKHLRIEVIFHINLLFSKFSNNYYYFVVQSSTYVSKKKL